MVRSFYSGGWSTDGSSGTGRQKFLSPEQKYKKEEEKEKDGEEEETQRWRKRAEWSLGASGFLTSAGWMRPELLFLHCSC